MSLTSTVDRLISELNTSLNEHHVETLKAAIFETPDLNLAKIQIIKEALANGNYQIDSQGIAARLMDCFHVFKDTTVDALA